MTLQPASPVAPDAMSAPRRILVVDDSFIMRRLVSEIVEADPLLTVVGQAENGRAATLLMLPSLVDPIGQAAGDGARRGSRR